MGRQASPDRTIAFSTVKWDKLCAKAPESAAEAYKHLATDPLTRRAGRQFPLKGKRLKPFWELEVNGGDRIFYPVCIQTMTVIIAVRRDAHDGAAVTELIGKRATAELVRLAREGTRSSLTGKSPINPAADAAESRNS